MTKGMVIGSRPGVSPEPCGQKPPGLHPSGRVWRTALLFPSFHYMWGCGPRALSFGESWFLQEEPTQEKRKPACLHRGTRRVSPLSAMVWGFWLFILKRMCRVFAVTPCSCVELWVIVRNWGQELHSAPRARTSPCLLSLEWFQVLCSADPGPSLSPLLSRVCVPDVSSRTPRSHQPGTNGVLCSVS